MKSCENCKHGPVDRLKRMCAVCCKLGRWEAAPLLKEAVELSFWMVMKDTNFVTPERYVNYSLAKSHAVALARKSPDVKVYVLKCLEYHLAKEEKTVIVTGKDLS